MGNYEDPVKKRERQKRYYRKNVARESVRSMLKTKAKVAAAKAYLLEYLRTHPCIDCGEADPVVLEFDHIDPMLKRFTMAEARRGKHRMQDVIAEAAKCEVRCANCHRRRTAQQAARGEIQFGIALRKISIPREASGTATTMAPSGPL